MCWRLWSVVWGRRWRTLWRGTLWRRRASSSWRWRWGTLAWRWGRELSMWGFPTFLWELLLWSAVRFTVRSSLWSLLLPLLLLLLFLLWLALVLWSSLSVGEVAVWRWEVVRTLTVRTFMRTFMREFSVEITVEVLAVVGVHALLSETVRHHIRLLQRVELVRSAHVEHGERGQQRSQPDNNLLQLGASGPVVGVVLLVEWVVGVHVAQVGWGPVRWGPWWRWRPVPVEVVTWRWRWGPVSVGVAVSSSVVLWRELAVFRELSGGFWRLRLLLGEDQLVALGRGSRGHVDFFV